MGIISLYQVRFKRVELQVIDNDYKKWCFSLLYFLTELLGMHCGKKEETVPISFISVEGFLDNIPSHSCKHHTHLKQFKFHHTHVKIKIKVLDQISQHSGILHLLTSPSANNQHSLLWIHSSFYSLLSIPLLSSPSVHNSQGIPQLEHPAFSCSLQKRFHPKIPDIKGLSKAETIRPDMEIKDPGNKSGRGKSTRGLFHDKTVKEERQGEEVTE